MLSGHDHGIGFYHLYMAQRRDKRFVNTDELVRGQDLFQVFHGEAGQPLLFIRYDPHIILSRFDK